MDDVNMNLARAFDQIAAFRAIHEPSGVSLEAVLCLQEAVGIDDATRILIRERLFETVESDEARATFLGLIIGLLASGFGEAGHG